MIKKAYAILKSQGIGNFLKTLYYYLIPRKLAYYQNCQSVFQTGSGLEIGGPSSIFNARGLIPVYADAVKIDNVNFDHSTVWEGDINEGNNFKFSKQCAPGRQYIGEASDLKFIEDSFYDFVLSSHCIEHLANPIKGLSEWIRTLKSGGLLALVVPHKDGTFDHCRPVTFLSHLIDDFDNQLDESDLTHLEEILKLHDLTRDPGAGNFQSFKDRSLRNEENRCLHQHVFDTRLVIELVNYVGLQILAVELFLPYHIVVISEKLPLGRPPSNKKYLGPNLEGPECSPFPSDHDKKHSNVTTTPTY